MYKSIFFKFLFAKQQQQIKREKENMNTTHHIDIATELIYSIYIRVDSRSS